MLIGNFIALNEYIRKEKISKTSHPNFHIRKPENVDQIKFQVSDVQNSDSQFLNVIFHLL